MGSRHALSPPKEFYPSASSVAASRWLPASAFSALPSGPAALQALPSNPPALSPAACCAPCSPCMRNGSTWVSRLGPTRVLSGSACAYCSLCPGFPLSAPAPVRPLYPACPGGPGPLLCPPEAFRGPHPQVGLAAPLSLPDSRSPHFHVALTVLSRVLGLRGGPHTALRSLIGQGPSLFIF